jgi:hypothetical protein
VWRRDRAPSGKAAKVNGNDEFRTHPTPSTDVPGELPGFFFVKRIFEGEKSGCYACTALFSGFEVKDGRTVVKTPTSWSEKDQAKWQAIIAACNEVSVKAFKKPMMTRLRPGFDRLMAL